MKQKADVQDCQMDPFLNCATFVDLQSEVESLVLDQLPTVDNVTFCNTNKVIDNNSLPLVPEDIPLKPTCQLYPCSIYGDGNCLTRAASVFAYGHERHHVEKRKRIVRELVQNEKFYLDNEKMRKGKHPDGDDNVTSAFASYSEFFMANKQLTIQSIRSIYRKEVLEVKESGKWMGLWQIASLANILQRPVVSVSPEYGANNTRKDMHRVFYPFEDYVEANPAFFMWTNVNGIASERDYVLNHFTAMMPLDEEVQISESDSDNSFNADGLLGDWMFHDNIFNQNIKTITPDVALPARGGDIQDDTGSSFQVKEDEPSDEIETTSPGVALPDAMEDRDTHYDTSSSFQVKEDEPRYYSGDYILIKHGRSLLPGVVDEWPWVQYFTKKKNRWLNGIK